MSQSKSKSKSQSDGPKIVDDLEGQCPNCGFFQLIPITKQEKRTWDADTIWQQCNDCGSVEKFRVC